CRRSRVKIVGVTSIDTPDLEQVECSTAFASDDLSPGERLLAAPRFAGLCLSPGHGALCTRTELCDGTAHRRHASPHAHRKRHHDEGAHHACCQNREESVWETHRFLPAKRSLPNLYFDGSV